MLHHGIDEPSVSVWCSPVPDKSNKSHFFCTNFPKVKPVMKLDSFLLG